MQTMEKQYPPPKPRYRVKGSFSEINSNSIEKDRNCSFGTVISSRNTAVQGEVLETWDVITPRFAKRSREGELITNPFRRRHEIQNTYGVFCAGKSNTNSCSSPVKQQSFDVTGPEAYWRRDLLVSDHRVKPVPLLTSAEFADAISVASTQAWDEANQHTADVLVDIAEMRQLLRMLRDPIQSTSSLLKKIQLGKRGVKDLTSQDAIDYANKLWLQYRFGIRPLVSTVNGVVKALGNFRKKKRITSRGKYNLKKEQLFTGNVPGGIFSFGYTEQATDEYFVRTGLVIEEITSLSQELGVDASGMLALPWELVPFSFVADWFANVNDFLGALVPYLTKDPLASWTTTTRRQTTVFTVTGSSIVSGWTMQRYATEVRSVYLEEKIRMVGLAAPRIAWKPQGIQKVLNDLRVVDSFALLHQQFSKVFKP